MFNTHGGKSLYVIDLFKDYQTITIWNFPISFPLNHCWKFMADYLWLHLFTEIQVKPHNVLLHFLSMTH